MKKILFVTSILSILALSACGGSAPTQPVISVLDMQNTAVALAWTNVALTQLAMPTNTPVPPTLTPEPTFTFVPTFAPLPTQAVLPTAAAAQPAATKGADCNQPIALPVKGTTAKVKFVNKAKGSVSILSFGMYKPNDKNECGIFSFVGIGQGQEVTGDVLLGCYWAFAYVNGSKTSTAKSPSAICIDGSKVIGVTIKEEWIGVD